MFAVIRTGGKQYRVAAEDVIKVEKVKGNPGEIVQFGDVLVVGGDSITLGQPTIAGASVAAEVVEQGRGPKIIAFKKRRRKNSRRRRGHRQEFTLVRITEILTDGAQPSPRAARAERRTEETSAVSERPRARRARSDAVEDASSPAAAADKPEKPDTAGERTAKKRAAKTSKGAKTSKSTKKK